MLIEITVEDERNFSSGAYPVPDSMKKEYEYADEGATAAS